MKLLIILFIIILFSTLSKKQSKDTKKIKEKTIKKIELTKFSNLRGLHILELQLDFYQKKVLDIGSINGNFSKIISKLQGEVTLSTPNEKIFNKLSNKYKVIRLNVENQNDFEDLEYFDYILCYDVLEHIRNPLKAIENMASKTNTLIIESTFSNFYDDHILNIKNEKSINTSDNEIGSRFSRDTMYKALNNHFDYIYSVKKLPDHSSYQKDWNKIHFRDNLTQKSRDILIASKKNIQNKNLEFGLIKIHN